MREFTTQFSSSSGCLCGAAVPRGVRIRYDRDSMPPIRACPQCDATLQDATPPKPLELRLVVERIARTNGDGSWAVLEVSLDEDQPDVELPVSAGKTFSAVGAFQGIAAGDHIAAHGQFEIHARFGSQFQVAVASKVVGATVESIAAFLEELPGIGKKRAEAIIELFGEDRDAIVRALEENPDALTRVKGITAERAAEIHRAYKSEARDLRDTHFWLSGLKLGEGLQAKILKKWKKDARAVLEENPYKLMDLPKVGFRTADEIALQKFNIQPLDVRRAAAAVIFLLQEEENEGHTWTPLQALVGYTSNNSETSGF